MARNLLPEFDDADGAMEVDVRPVTRAVLTHFKTQEKRERKAADELYDTVADVSRRGGRRDGQDDIDPELLKTYFAKKRLMQMLIHELMKLRPEDRPDHKLFAFLSLETWHMTRDEVLWCMRFIMPESKWTDFMMERGFVFRKPDCAKTGSLHYLKGLDVKYAEDQVRRYFY